MLKKTAGRILKEYIEHLKCTRSILLRNYGSGLSYKHYVGRNQFKYIPLGEVLSEAVERWPDRPAIISKHQDRTITYAELLTQADKLAASLRNLGLDNGDRLGIWMPNYLEWVVAMMAAARSGLVFVAINHLYEKTELSYALQKVGVKGLLAPGPKLNTRFYRILNELIPELSTSKAGQLKSAKFEHLKAIVLVNGEEECSGALNYDRFIEHASTAEVDNITREAHLVKPDSACNIQYTSGTTGDPKAAVVSHFSIVNNSIAIGHRSELSDKKICVQVPLFHAFGVVVTMVPAMCYGSTLVLPSAVYSPKANLEALISERCEILHGTPTMYVDLVSAIRARGLTDINTYSAVTAGSCVAPTLVEDMKNTLNLSKVKSLFGMTECSASSFQSLIDEDPQRPLNYLGHLQDHLEARVVNENDEMVPFGQPGELHVRGYSVMMGYWGDEARTKETIGEDKWLRTGDQVILHEDGYSQITGRIKDLIIRGGENIAPKEIEDVISVHPDVLECQVFAVSDDRLGEEVCAAIRIKEGAEFSEKKFANHVAGRLAKYKVPKIIKQVQNFPKTASGKVQKYKLKQMVESGNL